MFTHYNRQVHRRFLIIAIVLIMSGACGYTPAQSKPIVDVISPLNGTRIAPGDPVPLHVAAASSNQIKRIEARVNDTLIAAQDNPSPGLTYSTLLQFTPQQGGLITISVTAVDAIGQTSDPVVVVVFVGSGSLLTEPASALPAANATLSPSDCQLAATFVTDVTIPDHTTVKAGAVVVKTWRIRNTSQCAWENGYVLAYLEDTKIDSPGSVAVPPTARDAMVDISVPFTVPLQTGTYTTTWRMRNPQGTAFGNRVFMIIQVQ